MVSREHKKAALHEKLQLLRSITKSHALNETSILADASNYIRELKQKVDTLNHELEIESLPMVEVENLEKGYQIKVSSERSCPGLLVCILEAFEELGLEVTDARVNCSESFHFEAVGESEKQVESMDAQAVKQAILQAIRNSSGSS